MSAVVRKRFADSMFRALPAVAIICSTSTVNCVAEELTPPSKIYRGEVSSFVSPALDNEIKELTDTVVAKYVTDSGIDRQERRFNSAGSKALALSKDAVEVATEFKGFEQSSEVADVILNEKRKLKSRASVAYAKQSDTDKLHSKIVVSLLQIAMGNGLNDESEKASAITAGANQLAELVGKERAARTVELLNHWCIQRSNLELSKFQPIGGPLQVNEESASILSQSLQNDSVVNEIKGQLHRYNGRSNLARAGAKIINTSLSAASMTPTIVSPVAQGAWVAFIMSQGGSEEGKLVKEVYLAKRFESRWSMLHEETSLLVNTYNSAVYCKNRPLLAFSQFLINRMCEPVKVSDSVATVRSKDGEFVVVDSAILPPSVPIKTSGPVATIISKDGFLITLEGPLSVPPVQEQTHMYETIIDSSVAVSSKDGNIVTLETPNSFATISEDSNIVTLDSAVSPKSAQGQI